MDLRVAGSGNVGAMNAFKQVGIRSGVFVLAADVSKGVLAVFIPVWLGAPSWAMYVTAGAVVAGHNWPLFLGFRGGRGVATVAGISLAVLPLLTLIVIGPTILVFVFTRNIVLAVAFGLILLNALTAATAQSAGQITLCLALSIVVTATHYFNVRRPMVEALRRGNWKAVLSID